LYLDFSKSGLSEEEIRNSLIEYGYPPRLLEGNKIRIFPMVHFTSGGIDVDANGLAKGLENLYVIGEAAAFGDKGSGRLPGQAFTEAIL